MTPNIMPQSGCMDSGPINAVMFRWMIMIVINIYFITFCSDLVQCLR